MVWCPVHFRYHHGVTAKNACDLAISKSMPYDEALKQLRGKYSKRYARKLRNRNKR